MADEPAITIQQAGKAYRLYRRASDKALDALGLARLRFWKPIQYREFWALRGLNLRIARGERLGILGHNGAGKSTLLKLITGNLQPTEGQVHVAGRVQALLELGTGFHPEFTGRQNIRAALALQGVTGGAALAKEEEIVDFAELDQFIEQPVKTYSAGMYARLAFATATSTSPEILIIDEILGAGDAYFVGKCVERMRAMTDRAGTTVLFVSHDLSSVQKLSTRAIWLKAGSMIADGPAAEVIRDYSAEMEAQNEARLRSREVGLHHRQARAFLDSQHEYSQFLFRFRAESPVHTSISRLALTSAGSTLSELNVGGPMDNDANAANHINDNTPENGWGEARRVGETFARTASSSAQFQLSARTDLLADKTHLRLSIRHDKVDGGTVVVEMFQGDTFTAIGSLNSEPGTSALEIPPVKFQQVEIQVAESNPESFRILGALFVLPNGRDVRIVPRGSNLAVRVHFEATVSIPEPVFSLTIHRPDGTRVDFQSSEMRERSSSTIRGKGEAVFHFNPFRLGSGDYLISVAAMDAEKPDVVLDRHERAYCLKVVPPLGGKDLGMVIQECSFAMRTKASTDGLGEAA